MPSVLAWLLRLGPTNPIAVRLVQTGSARARHMALRTAYLGVLIGVLTVALLGSISDSMSFRDLAAAGATTFTYVAYVQVALICVLAPVFMAGAIAQEADPRTWDILLSTPLSATQVVLGNLLGRLFFILALLFSSLPIFVVTQYFGGVSASVILGGYAIAGGAAVFVGSAAVALSVSRLVGRRAVFAFYVGVVTFLAITLAGDALLRGANLGAAGGRGVTWFTALNPFLTLRTLLSPSAYPTDPAGVGGGLQAWFLQRPLETFLLLSFGLSALLVGASIATVRAGGLGARAESGSVSWLRRLLRLGAPGSGRRPPRRVWSNPIAWREAASRNATPWRTLARWSFIGLGLLGGLGLTLAMHLGALTAEQFRTVLLATVFGELIVVVLVAVNASASAISKEREDGTLDLLLTTPITPRAYLLGKLRGIIVYLLPMASVPIVTVGAAGLWVAFRGAEGGAPASTLAVNAQGQSVAVPVVLEESLAVAALATLPFLALVVMVGMTLSLHSRGVLGAVAQTFGAVAVLAGLVGLCGWKSAADFATLGPVLGGMSPGSAVLALVQPESAMRRTFEASGGSLRGARAGLVIGSVVGAAAHTIVVIAFLQAMVAGFDRAVRRLAGTR